MLLPACTAHELIVPGTYRIHDVYEVQVPTVWNRVPDFKEIWTMDGLPLQSLTFFPPLSSGRSITGRGNKRRDIAPPVFRCGMTEMEIMDFLETSWRLLLIRDTQDGHIKTRTACLRPEIVGNEGGFSFEMEWSGETFLDFKGLFFCVVKNGRLHVALYQGTRVGFYDRHLADARAVMESLHVLGNRKAGKKNDPPPEDDNPFMDWESVLERLGMI